MTRNSLSFSTITSWKWYSTTRRQQQQQQQQQQHAQDIIHLLYIFVLNTLYAPSHRDVTFDREFRRTNFFDLPQFYQGSEWILTKMKTHTHTHTHTKITTKKKRDIFEIRNCKKKERNSRFQNRPLKIIRTAQLRWFLLVPPLSVPSSALAPPPYLLDSSPWYSQYSASRLLKSVPFFRQKKNKHRLLISLWL